MSVVVEHGTFGARAAAPIAKDVMTFLFDPGKAMATLLELEKGWGGTPTERMASKYSAYVSQVGTSAPKVSDDEDESVKQAAEKAASSDAPTGSAESGTRPEEPVSTSPKAAASSAAPAEAPAPAPATVPNPQ
jgi:penicillin-binding protein 2